MLAVGRDPEVLSTGTNISHAAAQPVTLPVTVNGKIGNPEGSYYKFQARKGNKVVFEVAARRLGSDLDSYIEVRDSNGKPIEVAVARAVMETFTTLRDHDSVQRGIRMSSVIGIAVGDYLMAGNEIMRVEAMPPGPDDDLVTESFAGQRLSFFGTSGEAHHADQSVYRTEIHPAGSQFSPNGLPLVRLYAKNDDGGPGFGKDSRLEFVAPADGDYTVNIRDVRGFSGDTYAYRFNIRPPRPDFRLSVNPRNPNVPVNGAIPVTVTALRLDDFDGPIEVQVEGAPGGIKPQTAVIKPGQVSTTLTIAAQPDAKAFDAAPFVVTGRATAGSEKLVRYANPEDKLKFIALMPNPDIQMTAVTREVTLEQGSTAEITVQIERLNGFAGRVPVEVRNLQPRVRVTDTGLNGVLINEEENKRSFTIEALENAAPGEQLVWVSGRVETRSPLPTSYAAVEPVLVKVKPRTAKVSAVRDGSIPKADTAPATK
jgi:hypothetical protein